MDAALLFGTQVLWGNLCNARVAVRTFYTWQTGRGNLIWDKHLNVCVWVPENKSLNTQTSNTVRFSSIPWKVLPMCQSGSPLKTSKTYIHPLTLCYLWRAFGDVSAQCLHQTDVIEVGASPSEVVLMSECQNANEFTINSRFLKHFSLSTVCYVFPWKQWRWFRKFKARKKRNCAVDGHCFTLTVMVQKIANCLKPRS